MLCWHIILVASSTSVGTKEGHFTDFGLSGLGLVTRPLPRGLRTPAPWREGRDSVLTESLLHTRNCSHRFCVEHSHLFLPALRGGRWHEPHFTNVRNRRTKIKHSYQGPQLVCFWTPVTLLSSQQPLSPLFFFFWNYILHVKTLKQGG